MTRRAADGTALGRRLRRAGAGWLVLCLSLAACGTPAARGAAGSVYTSIEEDDCRPPPAPVRERYEAQNLGVEECPAPAGHRLYLVSSEARSWLDVARDGEVRSLEDAVVYKDAIGYFPNVGGSDVVEWRLDAAGEPVALIFRVVAQAPDPDRGAPLGAADVSRLFVVRLGDEAVCLLGVVQTNAAARALADGPETCRDAGGAPSERP